MYVESTHHAWRFAGGEVVGNPTAHHNHIARHQRRRGLLVVAFLDFAHVGFQIDYALITKVLAGLAGPGIECDQASVASRQKHACGARGGWLGRCVGCSCGCGEVAQASAALPVGRTALRVELPALSAGVSIQCEYFAVGGAGVHRVADLQRGVLVFCTGTCALRNVAGVEGPGNLQLVDVALVDLIQSSEPVTCRGIAPVCPVLLLGTRCHRDNSRHAAGADHMARNEHVADGRHNTDGQQTGQTIGTAACLSTRSANQCRVDQRNHQADHGKGQ